MSDSTIEGGEILRPAALMGQRGCGWAKRSVIASVALGLIIASAFVAPVAFAYQTYSGHKLVYGVSGQKYWIDSSATDYAGTINQAMYDWVHTSTEPGLTWTPIYYTRTYTKSSSRMDIYQYSTTHSGFWAITYMFRQSTQVSPWSTDWVWAQIKLDASYDNYWNKKGCVAHEMGHAMGLWHEDNNMSAIMNQSTVHSGVSHCGLDDLNGINYLY